MFLWLKQFDKYLGMRLLRVVYSYICGTSDSGTWKRCQPSCFFHTGMLDLLFPTTGREQRFNAILLHSSAHSCRVFLICRQNCAGAISKITMCISEFTQALQKDTLLSETAWCDRGELIWRNATSEEFVVSLKAGARRRTHNLLICFIMSGRLLGYAAMRVGLQKNSIGPLIICSTWCFSTVTCRFSWSLKMAEVMWNADKRSIAFVPTAVLSWA